MVLATLMLFSGTEASPAWSVGPYLGASSLFTGHQPRGWTYSGRKDFDARISTLEAEVALRGHWALGARFMTDLEDTHSWPGSRTVRRSGTGVAYAKRILIAKGPCDLSAWGGLGYQHIATEYIKVNSPLFNPDPPVKPADESEGSPAAIIGLSQRVFYYVAGLTLNESVQVSANAVSLRLELGMPLGWHKR